MGDLNNKYIDESYGSLLKTTEDTGLSGNTKTTVQDGNGTDTSLKISTEVVDVNGDLQTSGTTRVQGDGELVNVSGNISQFTNDSGYLDTLPTDLLRIGDNISELNNNSGYLTAGTLPSNVMKEGENVSLLTNDAGYLTSIPNNVMLEGENNSLLNNDSGYISSIPNTYLESGDNVSELVNDSGYLTSIPANVMLEGENNSLLNNDSGFITGINTGVIEISGGGGVQQSQQPLTDQDGTATGQFIWPVNGAAGNENDTTIANNSFYYVKNNRWDINNSPMDTINSLAGYFITDENDQQTFNILQNRFGGVTYYNSVPGQDHIFGGGGGGGLIRMGAYNSDNNSDNWYEAYSGNLTSVNLNGNDLEFESRNNGNISTVTLPGGGGPTSRSTIKAPLNGSNDFYRLNVPTVSYAGSNYTIGLNTLKMNPFQGLAAGQELKKAAILVNSAVAGSTIDLGLYKVSSNSENGLYASDLVFTIATGIDTSTTGRKEITGLSFTIPSSESELFYVGILQTAGSGSVALSGPQNTNGVTYFGALNASFQNRAMSFIKSSQSSLPTSISESEWNTYSLSTTYAFVGFN